MIHYVIANKMLKMQNILFLSVQHTMNKDYWCFIKKRTVVDNNSVLFESIQ